MGGAAWTQRYNTVRTIARKEPRTSKPEDRATRYHLERRHDVIYIGKRVTACCGLAREVEPDQMKCPKCHVDMVPTERHKLQVNYCQSCKGMWFEQVELGELEDEVFDFGEDSKGTLFLDSTPTTDQCPECSERLQRFQYRFYDLEMELCPNQHGYWLEDDEDTRVLELMKREEADVKREFLAEDKWAAALHHMRSGSFFSRMRDFFHR